MAARTLGALTWLYLEIALVNSLPCCPNNMPMVAVENEVLCEDLSHLLVKDFCSAWFIGDKFKETSEKRGIEILGFKGDKYCTGLLANTTSAKKINVKDKIGKTVAIVCYPEDPAVQVPDHYTVYAICLLISTGFLAATLAFYLLLPELRDLQGICVMCLVLSLFFGCMSLAIIQFPYLITSVDNFMCIPMAMTTYFWMLSAFFWLNLNCFHIWSSSVLRWGRVSYQRILKIYLVVGWGIPGLFLIFAVISNNMPGENFIKPNFGVTSCWFQDKLEKWAFFYGPVMVLLTLNFYYFLSTARMLWREYRTPNPLPRIKSLRFKFCLYLKLFLAMGITWIFEVLSAIGDETWYATDILNCLQGVIIFLVMIVFRKRVWHLLAAKRICGVHLLRCWNPLVDEETLEGAMEQETTVQEDTRSFPLVENSNIQQSTNPPV